MALKWWVNFWKAKVKEGKGIYRKLKHVQRPRTGKYAIHSRNSKQSCLVSTAGTHIRNPVRESSKCLTNDLHLKIFYWEASTYRSSARFSHCQVKDTGLTLKEFKSSRRNRHVIDVSICLGVNIMILICIMCSRGSQQQLHPYLLTV